MRSINEPYLDFCIKVIPSRAILHFEFEPAIRAYTDSGSHSPSKRRQRGSCLSMQK